MAKSDFIDGVNNVREQIRALDVRNFNKLKAQSLSIFLRNNLLKQAEKNNDSDGIRIVRQLANALSKTMDSFDKFASDLAAVRKM